MSRVEVFSNLWTAPEFEFNFWFPDHSPHRNSPHGQLFPRTTHPIKTRPKVISPHRQLAPWTTRPMDNSPQGQLAPWTTRPMDNSPYGQPASSKLAPHFVQWHKKHIGAKIKVHFSKNVFVLPGDFFYCLALLKSYGGLKMWILILNTFLWQCTPRHQRKNGCSFIYKNYLNFWNFFSQCTYMVCVCDTILLVVEPIRITKRPTPWASCPWGELSVGRVVRGVSCPWGELSVGRTVRGVNCPWGELSMGRTVREANCPWGELSWGEFWWGEFWWGEFRWGELSGNLISSSCIFLILFKASRSNTFTTSS